MGKTPGSNESVGNVCRTYRKIDYSNTNLDAFSRRSGNHSSLETVGVTAIPRYDP